MLHPSLERSVISDYGKSPPGPPYLSGKTCQVVMRKVFAHRHGVPVRNLTAIEVTEVRAAGTKVIALFRSDGERGELAVHREGNTWTVWQLIGLALS